MATGPSIFCYMSLYFVVIVRISTSVVHDNHCITDSVQLAGCKYMYVVMLFKNHDPGWSVGIQRRAACDYEYDTVQEGETLSSYP